MCFGAIGTDTGGSVREPAAFCGLVGLKPTYGLVSLRGVFPLSPSLDHVGPLCRTVTDTSLVFQAIADGKRLEPAIETKRRIGIARQPFCNDLDSEIESAFHEAVNVIRLLSSDIREIDLPPPCTAAVQWFEVYALHSKHFAKTPEKYGVWMQERLKQAAVIDEVTYKEAQTLLDLVRYSIGDVFRTVDFVITPTTPVPPITIEQALSMSPDPAGELWLRNTRPFNSYGVPTISVPCGFTRAGLPIGLQIAGPKFNDASLLSFALAYEQATEWHRRRPTLPS
jgi:aspartyl-tRNA(Asn)/glutamyl-tRNA(Gln) amidotransferase subunit A